MADPFSITASAAGVVSLGLTVSQGLRDYYESYKQSGSTVAAMYNQLEALASTLALLNKVIENGNAELDPDIARRVEESIESCREGVEKLDKKLTKIRTASQPDSAAGIHYQLKLHVHKAMFPFKESTLVKLREVMIELRNDLGLVLGVLQIDVSTTSLQRLDGIDGKLDLIVEDSAATSANVLKFGQDIEAISDVLSASQQDEERRRIHEWLHPPDPFANHDAARLKHEKSTNEWLLQGADFAQWLNTPKSLMLLYGIPGSGKTIIASSIIAEIEDTLLSSKSALVYYYFDFNDRRKQTSSGCISSLIMQLALVTNNFDKVWLLYMRCEHGLRPPTVAELGGTLRDTLDTISKTYFVLDALDECQELDEVLEFILGTFEQWDLDIRLLATTRKERNIDETLDHLKPIVVNLQDDLVTNDIQLYVRRRLRANARLKKWCFDQDIKEEIERTLIKGADGMFRWVVCQLDALQKCLTAASLKKTLRSLPTTLYDTYDRILLGIDPAYHEQAIQILQWLVVSQRPLYIEEAAEAVTILPTTPGGLPAFDADNRLSDPNDVFQICLSLVNTTIAADSRIRNGQLVSAEYMRLAHYSVKEYLVSEAIARGPCSAFQIEEREAHASVAMACIAYLLHIEGAVDVSTLANLPLAEYAGHNWNIHTELGDQSNRGQMLDTIVVKLLTSSSAMANVRSLCKPHYPVSSTGAKPALHWAVQYGLLRAVEMMTINSMEIHVRGLHGISTLHVAVNYRQEDIARLLLQKGADVNAMSDDTGTGLHYAVLNEDISAVSVLLEALADPNLRRGLRTTPLYLATERDNTKIMRLLLDHGADPNGQCNRGRGILGTPLQVAAWRGHFHSTKMLLDAGAVFKDMELQLLAQGKAQEALQSFGETGIYPYHFQNELPDYKDIVKLLQAHLDKSETEPT